MLDKEKIGSQEWQDQSPANNSVNDSSSKPWQALFSLAFWRRNSNYILVFAPKCVLPAVLVSTAMIIMVVGNVGFYTRLGNGPMTVSELIGSAAFCLISGLIGLVLFVVGFGRWLFVLTTFCRYWLKLERQASPPDKNTLKEELSQTIDEVRARSSFLTQFWFQLFAVMLLPILIVYLSAAAKLVSSRNLVGGPLFSLPPFADTALLAVIVLLGIFIVVVSFVSVPVAAAASGSPGQSVKLVFSLTRSKLPQFLLLSAVVVFFNILLGGPVTFVRWSAWAALMPNETLQLCIAQELWQGISSIVLLPLSLVPFCQLMKDLVHES
ncbi:MAG: hypothetical protein C5B53_05850 [Candidatus Melainabacteria bacterium]|nr:MAG: hypothetical protein C5B53_05850 [Candidatus Melainabacteria bacterium]